MKPSEISFLAISLFLTIVGATPASDRNFKKGLALYNAESCNALVEHATSSWWYSWGKYHFLRGWEACVWLRNILGTRVLTLSLLVPLIFRRPKDWLSWQLLWRARGSGNKCTERRPRIVSALNTPYILFQIEGYYLSSGNKIHRILFSTIKTNCLDSLS